MKVNGDYIMREVAGDHILVPVGRTALGFNGMIMLNPVGAVIWECLSKGMGKEEILNTILDEYDVDRETAEKDMNELLTQMMEKGFVVE